MLTGSKSTYLWAILPLLVLAGIVFPSDYRISQAFQEPDLIPGDVRRGIILAEVFAHGIGVAYILAVVACLDRSWPKILRIGSCALASGMLANVVKFMIARQRPSVADLSGSSGSSFLGWLPAFHPERFDDAFDYAIQSFPSAHSATAFGLAIGLSGAYPQGRSLFFFFAVLAGLQRILAGAHFPSDVLVGAALACLVSPFLAPTK
jgi:membrane-associated phospholipid phosphatase